MTTPPRPVFDWVKFAPYLIPAALAGIYLARMEPEVQHLTNRVTAVEVQQRADESTINSLSTRLTRMEALLEHIAFVVDNFQYRRSYQPPPKHETEATQP